MEAPTLADARVIESCVHTQVHHVHGTDTGYRCGCRCAPCSEARRLAVSRGARSRHVSADPVRAHIRLLHEHGMSYGRIASLANTDAKLVWRLASPDQAKTRYEVAAAILRVTEPALTPVGAVRRMDALQYAGWPQRLIATRLGCSRSYLCQLLAHTKAPSAELIQSIAFLADELDGIDPATVVGPSVAKRLASIARDHGYIPMIAWGDGEIDDPKATPPVWAVGPSTPMTVDERLDEVLFLVDGGASLQEAAARVGSNEPSVRREFYRKNIPVPLDKLGSPVELWAS